MGKKSGAKDDMAMQVGGGVPVSLCVCVVVGGRGSVCVSAVMEVCEWNWL